VTASLVIVTYKTGSVLRECLAAAGRADGVGEIIIVDNGNPLVETQAIDAFAAEDRRVRVLRGQGNVGFAKACNLGAAQAQGDLLVFVNPDVVLNLDAIARITEALSSAPPPAVIGGDLRDGDGHPERGSRRERLTTWRAFVSVTQLSRFERWAPALRDFNRHTDPMPSGAVRVNCISGALFAIRNADLQTIGGLDEGYFLHVDDVDLCRRAEQRGWPVVFLPGPHGVHRRSSSEVDPRVVSAHKARSMARYFQKFGGNPVERGVAGLVGMMLSFTSPRS
jgi:N-acetylglucosaminyl-diphospho-decaprenol L-rhamnosyltransferase